MDIGDWPTWISAIATVFIALFTLGLLIVGIKAGQEWKFKILYSNELKSIIKINVNVTSTLNNLFIALRHVTTEHRNFLQQEFGFIDRQDLVSYRCEAFEESVKKLKAALDEVNRTSPTLNFGIREEPLSLTFNNLYEKMIREYTVQQDRVTSCEAPFDDYRRGSNFCSIEKEYGVKTDFSSEMIILQEQVTTNFNKMTEALSRKSSL